VFGPRFGHGTPQIQVRSTALAKLLCGINSIQELLRGSNLYYCLFSFLLGYIILVKNPVVKHPLVNDEVELTG
jgi:hypothetical protein